MTIHRLPAVRLEESVDALFQSAFRVMLANDVIGDFLPHQRWFRGKAKGIASISITDQCKLGAGFFLVLAGVEYAEGGQETYVLPLKVAEGDAVGRVTEELSDRLLARIITPDGEAVLYDALADRVACAALVAAMADQRRFETTNGHTIRSFSTGGFAQVRSEAAVDHRVRQLSAEQSNTSVIIDDAYILKLFRRLEEGPNPDLEIGRFLSTRTDFRNVPPLAGGMSYFGGKVDGGTLVMLQDFVANEGDGWSWFLRRVGDFLQGLPEAESPPPLPSHPLVDLAAQTQPPSVLSDRLSGLFEACRTLGRRTAGLHRSLASEARLRDFRPEVITRPQLEALTDAFSRKAMEALKRLNGSLQLLTEDVRILARSVLSASHGLLRRYEGLSELQNAGQRIRVHGDLHLGQVLVHDGDFILIDFEGEPLRSLRERRRKASALKDVAGMLRSFHYLVRSAVGTGPGKAHADGPWVAALEGWMASSFIGAYLEESGEASLLPGRAELPALLDAFLLDKAFYELDYELNNRPDWVSIPLEGISRIARSTNENMEGRS